MFRKYNTKKTKKGLEEVKTRNYVYETLCSQQMIDHKDGQINKVQ